MTATDELRAMLDERGVEWRKPSPEYWMLLGMPEGDSSTIVGELSIEEAIDGTLVIWNATPEQAIAATLGSCNCSGNCTNSERTETCHVEWRENGWGTRTRHCGKCGADLDCDTRNRQNYCPNCGRKVVDE